MIKKVFAGVNKKYPIIIGKKSILKDFLPKRRILIQNCKIPSIDLNNDPLSVEAKIILLINWNS